MKPQKTLPTKNNKFYNTISNGGYSKCIVGQPTQSGLNVLDNCVGWACGRFNEIYSETTGYQGIKYNLNCNAEDFIKKAKSLGLKYQQKPTLGGIMVWEGKDDLAGHVAVVEQELGNDSYLTSESGYNHFAFQNFTRKKGSNGNYGLDTRYYKYIGCIVNPCNPKIDTLQYRVYVDGGGWTDWITSGIAGTIGQNKPLLKIEIRSNEEILASAHFSYTGWVDFGAINKEGRIGDGKIECLKLKGNFKYRVHIAYDGWTCWTDADGICTLGSVGQSRTIQAIDIIKK